MTRTFAARHWVKPPDGACGKRPPSEIGWVSSNDRHATDPNVASRTAGIGATSPSGRVPVKDRRRQRSGWSMKSGSRREGGAAVVGFESGQ